MGLFGRKGKIEDCGCGGRQEGTCPSGDGLARVQVMGTGCKKCHELYENALEALGEGGVEYVTDMARIAEAGVMALPALVVDGKAVCTGRVLTPSEVRELAGRP